MNGLPLFSKPLANSIIWVLPIVFWEPKEMYMTELGLFKVSHWRHFSVESPCSFPVLVELMVELPEERFNSGNGRRGPMDHNGRFIYFCKISIPEGSISITVFVNQPEDFREREICGCMNLDHRSVPFAALMYGCSWVRWKRHCSGKPSSANSSELV